MIEIHDMHMLWACLEKKNSLPIVDIQKVIHIESIQLLINYLSRTLPLLRAGWSVGGQREQAVSWNLARQSPQGSTLPLEVQLALGLGLVCKCSSGVDFFEAHGRRNKNLFYFHFLSQLSLILSFRSLPSLGLKHGSGRWESQNPRSLSPFQPESNKLRWPVCKSGITRNHCPLLFAVLWEFKS